MLLAFQIPLRNEKYTPILFLHCLDVLNIKPKNIVLLI